MKTILVPTDFSIPADYAIHYALKLAKIFDASIILYHTFIPFESGFYSLAQSDKENLETEKNLTDRIAKIRDVILKSDKVIPISIHVDRGPERIRLIEFCKKKKIDLIVMGTKGASGLKETIIGSFTADVMTKATCPVLAIPKKCKFKMPEKITYASDYNKKDNKVIQSLSKLNVFFQAKINILHIDDADQTPESEEKAFNNFKSKMARQFKEIPLSFQHITGRNIVETILQATLNDKTDILAMSPIKREGIWNYLFHKSITKTTAYHIRIPLLTIPVN
jgi:nucleotide-binding universal stress UspA family protein